MQSVVGFLKMFYSKFIRESEVKEFWKSVKTWQRYHHEYGVFLF